MPQISTVILAAGNSTRFKGNESKLTEKLAGLPIIIHIYKVALKISGKNVIIVCNQNNITDLKKILPNCIFIIQKKTIRNCRCYFISKKIFKQKKLFSTFWRYPINWFKKH